MSYDYGRHDFMHEFGRNYAMNGYDLSSTRYDFNNRREMPRQIAYAYDPNFPNQSGKNFFSNLEKSKKFKNFFFEFFR